MAEDSAGRCANTFTESGVYGMNCGSTFLNRSHSDPMDDRYAVKEPQLYSSPIDDDDITWNQNDDSLDEEDDNRNKQGRAHDATTRTLKGKVSESNRPSHSNPTLMDNRLNWFNCHDIQMVKESDSESTTATPMLEGNLSAVEVSSNKDASVHEVDERSWFKWPGKNSSNRNTERMESNDLSRNQDTKSQTDELHHSNKEASLTIANTGCGFGDAGSFNANGVFELTEIANFLHAAVGLNFSQHVQAGFVSATM
jgi:hypothetical protein